MGFLEYIWAILKAMYHFWDSWPQVLYFLAFIAFLIFIGLFGIEKARKLMDKEGVEKRFPKWVRVGAVIALFVLLLAGSYSAYSNKKTDYVSPEELRGSQFDNRDIVVAAALPAGSNSIQGKTFTHCRFYGPCIVTFDNDTTVSNTHIGGNPDSFLIGTSNEGIHGLIWFKDCVIKDCQFENMGWLIQEGDRERLDGFFTYTATDNWTMNKP